MPVIVRRIAAEEYPGRVGSGARAVGERRGMAAGDRTANLSGAGNG
jgi:hypothetical protein